MNNPIFVFYLVFGGNLILGHAILPFENRLKKQVWAKNLFIIIASIILAPFYEWFERAVLTKTGLESFSVLVFAIAFFLFMLVLDYLFRKTALGKVLDIDSDKKGQNAYSIDIALAVYGSILLASSQGDVFPGLIINTIAASIGYAFASTFINDIMAKMELEPVPEVFKGLPLKILTLGLIIMVFEGIDLSFYARLAGYS